MSLQIGGKALHRAIVTHSEGYHPLQTELVIPQENISHQSYQTP